MPKYVADSPKLDLTSVLRNNKHQTYENVDVLKSWPAQPPSDLDASQLAALRRILTKQLAIVQGPPGTGKTFVSVQAVKVMLANRKPGDPPIVIACQTNHSIDQILRQIADFEPDFVRLGGMSKDKDVIRPRTLYEVRKQTSEPALAGSLAGNARKKIRQLQTGIATLLIPLQADKKPTDASLLQRLGLITEAQTNSLQAGASQWVQTKLSNPNEAANAFTVWLDKLLVKVDPKQLPEEFGFEFEEADLEFEQLKELEAENVAKDDEDFETLLGPVHAIADNFTCRKVPGMTAAKVQDALKEQDMWNMPEAVRGSVYRHLQTEMKKSLLTAFRAKAKAFNELAAQRRIGGWESDECILKKQKIIGMTTTGLSKYRGLLAALEPRIVLIEEAAETLEAPITVACLPSLQHLILVGDHQQLRPHTHVKAHEDKPYYLNVSLFERMINNKVDFDVLCKQRRMVPEIRRLLYPIYGNLIKDHASVLDPTKRPPVPGMGGVNSFFFAHQWPEQRDDHMSSFNPDEADMIVGLVEHLVYNGVSTDDITLLTFYNGQRKHLLSCLRQSASLAGRRFNVVTVDSYQGEENKIVILSLVRSNDKGQIGFLNIDNRVCVALSRAMCGFYIFGNGKLLWDHSKTWKRVIDIMAGKKHKEGRPQIEPIGRVDQALPVRCSNHNNVVKIEKPSDWEKTNGGCELKCDGRLPCGHGCELKCHPFAHDLIICRQPCDKALPCGHGKCEAACGEVCSCKACTQKPGPIVITNSPEKIGADGKEAALRSKSSSESWSSYARDETVRYAIAASAPLPAHVEEKTNQTVGTGPKLFDIAQTEQRMSLLALEHGRNAFVGGGIPEPVTPQEMIDGDGARWKWKEEFQPVVSVVQEKGHVRDWSREDSLLD